MHPGQITILKRVSQNKKLNYYSLEWGKEKGERIATGVFTYKRPANEIQKHHNKEALTIIEAKRTQLVINHQITDSGYLLQHKLKSNFLYYYQHTRSIQNLTQRKQFKNYLVYLQT